MMMPAIGAVPVFATLIGAFGVWSIVFGLMNRNETNDLQQTHMTSHMPTIDFAFNAGELRLQQNL
jgi:hypothetical protein